jgi:N-acyl-D-amino-acid deacylase
MPLRRTRDCILGAILPVLAGASLLAVPAFPTTSSPVRILPGAEATVSGSLVPADPWDLLLVGGRVVDGTGNSWRWADVALHGDRIAAVAPPGLLDPEFALTVLDVSGLVVTPGFIDINGQSDTHYLNDGSALSKLFQGVTTEIMGESNSPAPVNSRTLGSVNPSDPTAVRRAREWQRFAGWLEEMEAGGVALNVGSFLGGTTVRRYAMGAGEGAPTPAQIDTMRAVTARAMEDGAFGVSSALIYPPGSYAGTHELIQIATVVAEHGGIYITHLRSESYRILEALDEAAEIGLQAGVPVEIYHLKAAGVDNWHLTDQIIERIEDARSRGIDMAASMYPYTAASTSLTACLPPWSQADGRLFANLGDPVMRARIRAEMLGPPSDWENWCRLATAEGSVVSTVSQVEHIPLVGRNLEEVARVLGVSDWAEAAMELILRDRSNVGMIYFAMSEEELRRKLVLPWMKFGTDGAGWNPARGGRQVHPRAFGTYPRILGTYVRDEGLLPLEDAVRKASAAVADRIGLVDRGYLKAGQFADLAVFDLDLVEDRSTYGRNQLASGVVHLFVNGEAVILGGEATGARPGRFVRGPGATEFNPPSQTPASVPGGAEPGVPEP